MVKIKTRLMTKKITELKEIYSPNKRLQKICSDWGIEPDLLDLTSLIMLRKDFSSDRAFIEEVIKPALRNAGGTEPVTRKKVQQIRDDIERDAEKTRREQLQQLRTEIRSKKVQLQKIINKSTGKRKGQKQAILKEITAYSPHTERYTISTLIAVALKLNVINVSEPGISKSRCTTELLDMLKIPYFLLQGHQTPKKFYQNLKQYNGGLIVIDESANLLRNVEILDNLLSALQKGVCYWESERGSDSFKFKGTLIFCSNQIPNTPIFRAVSDRCVFNHLKLNSEQIKEKILESRHYEPNKDVWETIKNNLFTTKTDISAVFLEYIYEIIKNINPKSFRDKNRFINIGRFSTMLIGDLSLIKHFVKLSTIDFILAKDVKRSEKVKMIATAKKIGKRHARRIVSRR